MSAKKTKEQFILEAIAKHGDKYDYSKVEYEGRYKEVIILCKQHGGEFKQKPTNHLRSGCRVCSIEKSSQSRRSNVQEFIKKAIAKHGDFYDYGKVKYVNVYTPVIITCEKHGDFEKIPHDHLNGGGCRKCRYEKSSQLQRSNNQEFIQKAIDTHGDKYDYSKVEYLNCDKNVIIVCKYHGDFCQTPYNHLKGSGCNDCSIKKNSQSRRSNTQEFIKKAIAKHGELYDYGKVKYGKNNEEPVIIVCKDHGEFKTRPYAHLGGTGCPKCNESKGENKISKILEQLDISYEIQHTFEDCKNIRCLPFDFYVDSHKLCIEYQGEQHYSPVKWSKNMSDEDCNILFKKIRKNDDIKLNYCKDNGINLLAISYEHFDNIEDILTKALNLSK